MDNLKNLIKAKVNSEEEKKKDKRGPRTPHQLLALEIAESFGKSGSRKDIAILMNLCKKYNGPFIRRIWGIVKEKDISNKMAYFLAIIKNMNAEEKQEKFKNLKIIFIGTSEFSVPALKKITDQRLNVISVITQPDRPVGRKKILTPSPIKKFAQEKNLIILQPEKISEITEKIKKLNPDLLVMVSYGQIIPQEIIEIPKYGCLNIHPSLLPKYRGSSPIQTAILNGDKQTGVTVMVVDEKMDHGPIVNSRKSKVESRNYTELHNELSVMGAELLIEILPDFIAGEIKLKKQDDKKATFTKILTRQDGKIDWSKKAAEIERRIRAFYPWPGTWALIENGKPDTTLGMRDKKLKIIKASILSKTGKNKKSGKIILSKNKKMAILCGQGSLILERIQPEGRKEMTGEEFMRGNSNVKKLL